MGLDQALALEENWSWWQIYIIQLYIIWQLFYMPQPFQHSVLMYDSLLNINLENQLCTGLCLLEGKRARSAGLIVSQSWSWFTPLFNLIFTSLQFCHICIVDRSTASNQSLLSLPELLRQMTELCYSMWLSVQQIQGGSENRSDVCVMVTSDWLSYACWWFQHSMCTVVWGGYK